MLMNRVSLRMRLGITSVRTTLIRSIRAMSVTTPRAKRVAVGQMCSGDDPSKNFEKVRLLAKKAKRQECTLLALPEGFSFIGTSAAESVRL